MSPTRSLTCVGTLVLAAICQVPTATAINQTDGQHTGQTQYTDLDDFSGDTRYTKYYNQNVTWTKETCGSFLYSRPGRTYLCAHVVAPKDWTNPDAGDIVVGISRIDEDTDMTPGARRLLLSNPGGPGHDGQATGTEVMRHLIGADQTITNPIGISPRGVGLSTQLVCPAAPVSPGSFLANKDTRTFTPESLRIAEQDTATYFAQCDTASGGLQQHITTINTARDYNLVRHVLGYAQADYWGVSYGTWLGATMIKMFPNKFDRVVLDGNANWQAGNLEATFTGQPEAVQAVVDQHYYPWIARHHERFGLGSTTQEVAETIEHIRAAAQQRLMGKYITPEAIDVELMLAARNAFEWDRITTSLVDWRAQIKPATQPETTPPTTATAPVSTISTTDTTATAPRGHSPEMFKSLKCADTTGTTDPATWQQRYGHAATTYPASGGLYRVSQCHGWAHPATLPASIHNRPIKQALMTDREADSATSYAGAAHSRATVRGTVKHLVVDDQIGHSLPQLESECAKTHTNNYLLNGVFPHSDVHCQAGPISVRDTRDRGKLMVDDVVYEFGNAGAAGRPAAPSRYLKRHFNGLPVDQHASEAARNGTLGSQPAMLPPEVVERQQVATIEEFLAGRSMTIQEFLDQQGSTTIEEYLRNR